MREGSGVFSGRGLDGHSSYDWYKLRMTGENEATLRNREVAKKWENETKEFQNKYNNMSREEQLQLTQQMANEQTRQRLMNEYNKTKEILDNTSKIMKESSSSLAVNMARRQNIQAKNTMSNLRTSFRNENLPFPGASNEFIAVGPEGDKHIIPRDYLK